MLRLNTMTRQVLTKRLYGSLTSPVLSNNHFSHYEIIENVNPSCPYLQKIGFCLCERTNAIPLSCHKKTNIQLMKETVVVVIESFKED
jgi:hypothetical protein